MHDQPNPSLIGIKVEYASIVHIMQLQNGDGYMRLINNHGEFTWYKARRDGWDWLETDLAAMAAIEAIYQEMLAEKAK